jgi:hypothetical protein
MRSPAYGLRPSPAPLGVPFRSGDLAGGGIGLRIHLPHVRPASPSSDDGVGRAGFRVPVRALGDTARDTADRPPLVVWVPDSLRVSAGVEAGGHTVRQAHGDAAGVGR